jgi:hypothetical protein
MVVNSIQKPQGMARGALSGAAVFAADIPLSGASVTPPVTTPATGITSLRLMAGSVFYYAVQVSGLPAGDSLTGAYIRKRSDNSVLLNLAASAAGFNVSTTITITGSTVTELETDSLYIDVRSRSYPAGLIAGRIR